MKRTQLLLILTALLLGLTQPTHAYWPTMLEEDVALGDNPDLDERYSVGISGPSNKTYIAFFADDYGTCYQILDRFGQPLLPTYTMLTPALPWQERYGIPKIISDGHDGAFTVSDCNPGAATLGMYAQRLDSLGNRLWGDSGVRIFPQSNYQFDICGDNQGGFWMAIVPGPCESPLEGKLYLQRVDSLGNVAFGDSGMVVEYTPQGLEYPLIVPDDDLGCFVIWEDNRLGVWVNAVYAQHYDEYGNALWNEDLYLCEQTSTDIRHLITDGEGGFIFHGNPGYLSCNNCYRVNSAGQILWVANHISEDPTSKIIPGEPGFFYLIWVDFDYYSVHVQKLDLSGNVLWGPDGIHIAENHPPIWTSSYPDIAFADPYLYTQYSYHDTGNDQLLTVTQKLDLDGNRLWGDLGIPFYTHPADGGQYPHKYRNTIPTDDGGMISVYEYSLGNNHDVYAKRVNPDGTLGGPLHLLVNLEPESSAIQIPPTGGTFSYNIAIEDTYVVHSDFDAWIEATLPGGDTREITLRENIHLDSNSVIERFDLVQNVPDWAPTGDYTYRLYVGDHDYPEWFWAMDEFGFEKVAGAPLAQASYRATNPPLPPLNKGGKTHAWQLTGFFDDMSGTSPTSSGGYAKPDLATLDLSVSPNPFNPVTTISFTLSVASQVTFKVFDIAGRDVTMSGLGTIPTPGYLDEGTHTITFDGSDLPSGIYFVKVSAGSIQQVEKIVLLK